MSWSVPENGEAGVGQPSTPSKEGSPPGRGRTERAPGDRDRDEPILLELVRNRLESACQLGAEGGHRRDSRHGDQSRNEAVLSGGGARLLASEAVEEGFHVLLLC